MRLKEITKHTVGVLWGRLNPCERHGLTWTTCLYPANGSSCGKLWDACIWNRGLWIFLCDLPLWKLRKWSKAAMNIGREKVPARNALALSFILFPIFTLRHDCLWVPEYHDSKMPSCRCMAHLPHQPSKLKGCITIRAQSWCNLLF